MLECHISSRTESRSWSPAHAHTELSNPDCTRWRRGARTARGSHVSSQTPRLPAV